MKRERIFAIVLTLCLTLILAACDRTSESSKAPESGSSSSSTDEQETGQISLMMAYWVDQPPKVEDNYLFEKFQEMLGVQLKLELYPSANYQDKAMLKLSSGQLPDVMWLSDATVKTKAVVDAAEAGAFWDCTDLMNGDDYPNLSWAITSTMKANASINGRLYGMPGPRPSARNGLLYRKDLFEKYDITAPEDIDSFYDAAKRLKENEPDLIPYSYESMIVNFLTVSQGGYNNWGVKDGNIVPAWDTPEYKNSLKVLRDMYSEKLMNQDFAITTGSEVQADLISGKAGMLSACYDNYEVYQNRLSEVDPTAVLDLVPVFNGTTNAQVGSALYTVSSAISEEKLRRIFQYFNDSLNQEILTWEYYGEEGRNYTLEGDIPTFISDEANQEVSDTLLVYKSCAVNPVVIHWPTDSEISQKWKNATEEYAESCVRDYASPLLSDTQTEKGGELDKLLKDARERYIMGEIDEAGYDAAVESWYAQGGSKIAEEYTAAYKKTLEND